MPPSKPTGSCLDCMHFERMFSACKFDFPRGFGKTAKRTAKPERITPTTDVRTFRCQDYLGWETGLLPFNTTPPAETVDVPAEPAGR